MTKVIILGGTGLLGHKLHYYLNHNSTLSVTTTVRSGQWNKLLQEFGEIVENVHASDLHHIKSIIQDSDWVINVIALIPQKGVHSIEEYLEINGYFPHRLAALCKEQGSKLIHISSDGVFKGTRGNYSENDVPDCESDYGYSKAVGEIKYGNNLTLRTSIIGTELGKGNSLFDWFRKESEDIVQGYSKSIWSGLTSDCLAQIINKIITGKTQAAGLYNVGIKNPISKYRLLEIINEVFNLNKKIQNNLKVVIDRSLDITRFMHDFKLDIPSIENQIEQIVDLESFSSKPQK